MTEDRDLVSIGEARKLVRRASVAQSALERFDQEQVDRIVGAMAGAAEKNSRRLAEMACEETGFGNPRDKHLKNQISFKYVYEYIRGMRTVGVLNHDHNKKVIEIAAPMGVVAAIIPSTNPTSTTIYKVLIAAKARNAIVISPHPAAKKCIAETARILDEAGRAAGLPQDAILCMEEVTLEGTKELMRFKETAVVLATGNMGLVKSAYSSGKPAYGVGPGNVPAYVHTSADIAKAARDIIAGKSFDYGTVCASEQSVVADRAIAAQLRSEMAGHGAYFLSAEEAQKVADTLVLRSPRLAPDPKLVGKSAHTIAKAAGVTVPEKTRCLVADLEKVGPEEPLSIEKLSPVLGFYEVADWKEGCERCKEILAFGGMGHTLAIHSNDEEVVLAFGLEKPAYRICVNTPATHGAVGYSTALPPSMTLGCGAAGNNITSDNITPRHLIDIKRVAYGIRDVSLDDGDEAPASKPSSTEDLSAKEKSLKSSEKPSRADVEELVDNFLNGRKTSEATTPPVSKVAPDRKAPEKKDSLRASETVEAAPAVIHRIAPRPLPPQQVSKPIDFVSEYDVRMAINKGETITVNDKTIITPLARELGEREGVFLHRK